MLSLALATALAATAPQAGPPPELRQAYSACLSSFRKAKLSEKLDDAAFRSAAQAACASQEIAFRNSIATYDVKMGMKKAAADEGAQLQVEDYLVTAAETYAAHAHAKPR